MTSGAAEGRLVNPVDDCTAPVADPLDNILPIPKVLSSHPGIGGHCYFGSVDPWFAECGRELKTHDFSNFGMWARNSGDPAVSYLENISHDPHNPNLATISYAGNTIKTNNVAYPWDDVYCHSNGFLKLPRDQVSNYTFWGAAARQKCSDLLEEFPAMDRTMAEMTARSGMEGDMPNFAGNQGILDGTHVLSAQNMRRHAAWKCALDPEGVGCDMAYCAVNFCELQGGYIGHTTECDGS